MPDFLMNVLRIRFLLKPHYELIAYLIIRVLSRNLCIARRQAENLHTE
jgi:hypothetical protein